MGVSDMIGPLDRGVVAGFSLAREV